MILFGRRALKAANVEIRALDRVGSSDRHIDNTFAILIKYGLMERASDPYVLSDRSSTSGSDRNSSDRSRYSPDSDESQNFIVVGPARHSIDVIKVHTVVQGFCRDELKMKSLDPFYRWLALATALFCQSYAEASERIKATRGPGHVRDYREYQTHARRLARHFPSKLATKTIDLGEYHRRLSELTNEIEKEIENRSPSSSQESVRNQKSIFDTANSMSSEPSTPGSVLSRSTWGTNIGSQSPEDLVGPRQPDFPAPRFERLSPQISVGHEENQSTSSRMNENKDDEGWQTVPPKQTPKKNPFWDLLSRGFRKDRGRGRGRGRGPRDLGDFRPAAAPVLTNVHGTASVPSVSASHRSSLGSQKMLENIRRASPARSADGTVTRPGPGVLADGRPTYAAVARGQIQRESLPNIPASAVDTPASPIPGSNSVHLSRENRPFSDMTDPDYMSQSAHSDPGMIVPDYLPFHPPGSRVPYSRVHLRNQRLAAEADFRRGNNLRPLSFESDIPVTRLRSPNTAGQLLPRQASPSPALLYGYGSQPITRDPSRQSNRSLNTEPPRVPPSFSPEPTSRSSGRSARPSSLTNLRAMATARLDSSPGRHMQFGQPELDVESDLDSPVSVGAQPMSRESSGPGILAGDGSVVEFGRVSSNRNIRFGDQEPISVDEARWRTEQYEMRLKTQQGRPGPTPYPTENLMPPTLSDAEQLEALVSVPETGIGRRARSGSSPARSPLYGLGLNSPPRN
jgi:hypothetical protein